MTTSVAIAAVLAPSILAGIATAAAARTARRAARLRRELAAATHAATHDQLTGLFNRAGLAAAWDILVDQRPAVALVDLNGFKPVNDRHGHAAGDRVLAVIADRLRGETAGAVGRLGGDEFALILTRGHTETALRGLAEMLAMPVRLPSGVTVRVTPSIGVTTGHMILTHALAAADAAMYRAKTTGAGVAVYDPHRDDHPTPATSPLVRTRDLSRASASDLFPINAHPTTLAVSNGQ